MVLNDLLALKVPNGLDARRAALDRADGRRPARRQPLAGHAGPRGRRARLRPGRPGRRSPRCAPRGVEPIVAADFSPTRRALATTMGAHEVVDPRDEPAIDAWRRLGGAEPRSSSSRRSACPACSTRRMRPTPRAGAQILVVGVCMQPDTVRPMLGIGKELNLQFVLGYDPLEFAETLRRIAEGELDVAPADHRLGRHRRRPRRLRDLGQPDAHAKILVEPS